MASGVKSCRKGFNLSGIYDFQSHGQSEVIAMLSHRITASRAVFLSFRESTCHHGRAPPNHDGWSRWVQDPVRAPSSQICVSEARIDLRSGAKRRFRTHLSGVAY